MLEKAEDTIYQKHYVSEEGLKSLLNMKGAIGKNPKRGGLVVHKGSDVSINIQLEEERMQGDQTIETTD